MTESAATDRLLALLHAALAQADVCGDTLVAALLAECIAAAEGDRRPALPASR